MKPGVLTLTAPQPPEAMAVLCSLSGLAITAQNITLCLVIVERAIELDARLAMVPPLCDYGTDIQV